MPIENDTKIINEEPEDILNPVPEHLTFRGADVDLLPGDVFEKAFLYRLLALAAEDPSIIWAVYRLRLRLARSERLDEFDMKTVDRFGGLFFTDEDIITLIKQGDFLSADVHADREHTDKEPEGRAQNKITSILGKIRGFIKNTLDQTIEVKLLQTVGALSIAGFIAGVVGRPYFEEWMGLQRGLSSVEGESFVKVWNLIERKHIDKPSMDSRFSMAAINALLRELGDSYTYIADDKEYKKWKQQVEQSCTIEAIEIKPGIIHIVFCEFNRPTFASLKNILKTHFISHEDSLRGFILDLRNNPGGDLRVVRDALSLFLPWNSLAVRTITAKGEIKEYTEKIPLFPDTPLVVLVGENSASGSEFFTAAIMDNNRGISIGSTTFGKATGQELIPLPNGSVIRISMMRAMFPKTGKPWDQIGITPDILVEDSENGEDRALSAALDYIQSKYVR